MLSKTAYSLSRTAGALLDSQADIVRHLSWRQGGDLLRFAGRRLREERLPQVAGSLTFTTTLALVPLLTIVLAIFTTFPIFNAFRASLETYFVQTLMPRGIANTIIGNLTQFASKATRLSAVGAVALLLTSTAMMAMIERAFNQIWGVRRRRPFTQRLVMYWALLTLGPVLFGLSLTVTSQLFMATSEVVLAVPLVGALFYTAVSVALSAGAYTLLYVTVPNRHVDWRDAIWGGLVAAVAFEIAKRGFAIFIRQFPTYAIIYGALAALPLFLLWLYLSWMIALVGATITAALPVIKYERWWYQPVPGGDFVDAVAILKVLYGGARIADSALVPSRTIRDHTRIGYEEMSELLDRMVAAGWVGRVELDISTRARWKERSRASRDNWVLLSNPDKLRLSDVYRLFVFSGRAIGAGGPVPAQADNLLTLDTATLARQVGRAVENGLHQSLAEHFGPL
ncbi:YihY family inner membrane protein [Massilia sp. DWR3-1-1]|uniref:YihY family inner membrane protein n=1 Tax=Massilia sp. DWR3-1-1 TaxID=2804559 RepID=UPI003CE738DC